MTVAVLDLTDYAIPFLCLASVSLLGWVLLLKTELAETKEKNRKLKAMLQLGVKKSTGDVVVVPEEHAIGKKPAWMK